MPPPRQRQPARQPGRTAPPGAAPSRGTADAARGLQQAVGNRALNRLVAKKKKPKTGKRFYKEVTDKIKREEDSRVVLKYGKWRSAPIHVHTLPFLYTLRRFCEAVDDEDVAATKAAAKELLATDPPGLAPYALSEDLANELLSRTHVMPGLETETAKLRGWLRKHTDTMGSNAYEFGSEMRLFELTVGRALERAGKATKDDARANLDLLLRSFKLVFDEASGLDESKLRVDKSMRTGEYSSIGPAARSISAYEGTLLGLLRKLHTAIERNYQILLDGAIAKLETGKGGADELKKVGKLLEEQIAPVVTAKAQRKSGDPEKPFSAGKIEVEITKTVQRGRDLRYIDALAEGAAAEKRAIKFTFYDPSQQSGGEKEMRIDRVVETRKAQIKVLEELYTGKNAGLVKQQKHGLRLHSNEDWRQFVEAKFDQLRAEGNDDGEALTQVTEILKKYLLAFTVHTPFNLDDFGDNYLTRSFPRALTGQVVHDCGVYALRIAYILSLLRKKLNLRFRFVRLPVHIGLVITGDNLPMFVVHNNQIQRIAGSEMAKLRKEWDRRVAEEHGGKKQPFDESKFAGHMAAAYYLPYIDMPYRMTDAPAFKSDDPSAYWKMYQGLQPDVLKGDQKFQLRYLNALEDYKRMYNERVRPFWNTAARRVWDKHSKALLAAFDAYHKDKKPASRKAFQAACAQYKTDLDPWYKALKDSLDEWYKKAGATSSALAAAEKDLVAPGATVAKHKRTPAGFGWEMEVGDYMRELAKTSDLDDPRKRDRLVPPFSDDTTQLPPWD